MIDEQHGLVVGVLAKRRLAAGQQLTIVDGVGGCRAMMPCDDGVLRAIAAQFDWQLAKVHWEDVVAGEEERESDADE